VEKQQTIADLKKQETTDLVTLRNTSATAVQALKDQLAQALVGVTDPQDKANIKQQYNDAIAFTKSKLTADIADTRMRYADLIDEGTEVYDMNIMDITGPLDEEIATQTAALVSSQALHDRDSAIAQAQATAAQQSMEPL
jgi:hypothetical protein